MKLLFRIALQNRRHLALLLVTFVAMLMLVFGKQLEMFAFKVLTSKEAGFFELFARDGRKADRVTKEQVDQVWRKLDREDKGYITQQDTERFIIKRTRDNPIDQAVAWLNDRIGIHDSLKALAAFLAMIAVFKGIGVFAQRYTTKLVAVRVGADLRQKYFEHIQMLPMSYYQKQNMGAISSRVVTDSTVIAEALNSFLVNYLQTPVMVVSTMAVCFAASWKLSLIVFIGFPAVVVPIAVLARMIKMVAKQLQRNQERFTSVLIDFLNGIQTIKIFAIEELSLRKYKSQNDDMARLEARAGLYDASSRPIVHSVATMFMAGAMIYGLYIERMDVSQVLLYCGLLIMLYEPVKQFAEMNVIIQRGVAAAERMNDVMALRPSLEDAPDAQPFTGIEQGIEFRNVHFRYEDEWVLRGLSFSVKKGETVAIVGPTGAGKSTIVQLIPRLYDPQEGEILIDGRPLKAYTQRSLREQIAFVPQRPFVFIDTVAQNISCGRDYSDEEVRQAAVRAHADEFIRNLPDGYDTLLSETGKNLSGGQQQRLAIARALVKRAGILVMDEATSSLDAVSESRIKTAIEELHGDVTQIIIAHRFSTIENADRIVYIDRGEKVHEGTREEMLQNCPPFRLMWEMMREPSKLAAV